MKWGIEILTSSIRVRNIPWTAFGCLVFCFLSFSNGYSQSKLKLVQGDLLFVDLDCGPLCDAIESVTESYGNQHFSHMGLVFLRNDSTFLIEAMGPGVRITPLQKFVSITTKPVYIGRLKPEYKRLIPEAVSFSLSQVGVPYDDQFLYENGKYYCSEMIFDAFKAANKNNPFFELRPMTFKKPGSNQFFPVWEEYFEKLRMEIPEGKPGCNPGGISMSDKLLIVGIL